MLLVESLLGSSSATAANYIEDVFSTYLYTGGAGQNIGNNIALGNGPTTAGWSNVASGLANGFCAVDTNKNAYFLGRATVSGNTDLWLAKYNSAGSVQWQKTIRNDATSANTAGGIVTDSSGNAYICGGLVKTNLRAFVAKYNSSGTIQWQKSLDNSTNSSYATGIALDGSGNVYITGYDSSSGPAMFVAKYNNSGALQWQRKLPSLASGLYGSGIAVSSAGNVYAVGYDNAGPYVGYVVAYNTSGTLQWQRRLTRATVSVLVYGVTLDSSENVYIASAYGSGSDFIIAKYNSSGTLQWQRSIGLAGTNDTPYSVVTDSSNNVYAVGSSAASKVLIVKYNSSGALQWQRFLLVEPDAGGTNIPQIVQTDSAGSIYVSGYYYNGTAYTPYLTKLADDGTGIGVYGSLSYSAANGTDAAGGLTDAAGGLTSSTSTYTDTTSTATDATGTVTNTLTNIPTVAGKGGMVWIKSRSDATDHALYDTARGATFDIATNLTTAQTTQTTGLTSFNGTGFTIGALAKLNGTTNASWTFRKQPKFFDIVTYTGTGANRTIAHNLGAVPGCIMIKRTVTTAAWAVYHRSLANTQYMVLNTTAAAATGATYWNSTTPTSSVFSLGTSTDVNASGGTYVAYIFAHDAGGFGATGTDNVISCGSFTTDGSGNASVTLGYEPQWVLYKESSTTGNWRIFDTMRGWDMSGNDANLTPNTSDTEFTLNYGNPTSTGFVVGGAASPSATFIYIAIRRGPMKTPTTGTSVFGLSARTGTGANATVTGGQTDDAILIKNRGSAVGDLFAARLTKTRYLETSSTAADVAAGTTILQDNPWDVMDGVKVGTTSTITNASANTYINYLFRRAPGFFDVVCYTGTGSARTISHNLGAVPQLIIVKGRSLGYAWEVYYGDVTKLLELNQTFAGFGAGTIWNNTAPTSSVFSLGSNITVNENGTTYVAYLFGTVAGVSKVFSYTGNGSSQTINCGFTGGARFVLIKRTDSTGNWTVFDSARGIVAGNDPALYLNSTAAEVTTIDAVDTDSSGFIVNQDATLNLNVNNATYIGLAIA
jgi:hypothetical protein